MSFPKGSVCWVEIPVRKDQAKLKEFYAGVFPEWEWNPYERDSTIMTYKSNTEGLGGGLVPMPAGCSTDEQPMGAGFTVYYMVDSVDEAAERIQKLGGKIALPKTDQAGMGWFYNMLDIEGNRFGIYEVEKK